MLKLKTELLKSLLSKSIKGCSFNKMVPITSFIQIMVSGGEMTLKSTDNITILVMKTKIEGAEDFRVVVDGNLFNNLIQKITTSEVELEVTDNGLVIAGNGNYILPIGLDEGGNLIVFPSYDRTVLKGDVTEFNYKAMATSLKQLAPSLPEKLDSPELWNFYFGDKILATNAFKLSAVPNQEELKNNSILIKKELGDLLMDFDFDKAFFTVKENKLYIFNEVMEIVSDLDIEQVKNFPKEAVEDKLSMAFPKKIKVNKDLLLQALDRLNLFIEVYDANAIDFVVSEKGVTVISRKSNGKEIIPFVEGTVYEAPDYSSNVKITDLVAILTGVIDHEVTIHYGLEEALKVEGSNLTAIMYLMEE